MHRRIEALLRLLLILAACVQFSPVAAQSSAQGTQERPLLGYHVSRADSVHLAAARGAGAQFVVVVFSWRDIEPIPGVFYWEEPDAALRAAAYYGLDVVARLDRAPDWALVEEGPAPVALDAYANFAARVAARYAGRLAGAIVWNEPNLAAEWNGLTPDPAGYAALLAAAYPAIKAADPRLPVALAGLAFTEGDGVSALNDLDYLQSLYSLGAAGSFDVLAAHAYGFGRPPEDEPGPGALNFRRLELHRALMEAAGDAATPVWITEAGWRTAAPAPADEWQVVSANQQADYSLRAVTLAGSWPWLERMAFWELNGVREPGDDADGYLLWSGPGSTTAAYRALAGAYGSLSSPPGLPQRSAVEIIAPDVTIRLGDRDELHPHWVHLHPSSSPHSPTWSGEFFVAARETERSFDLLLETMQVDQAVNHVRVNGTDVGLLQPRPRPDQTSTWTTQRLPLPAGLLRPGLNVIEVAAGQRNPVRQTAWWRWENFQFRNVRLESAHSAPRPLLTWWPRPAPAGWAETVRLRVAPWADGTADVWLLGNRTGQVWRSTLGIDGTLERMTNAANGRTDLLFTDVLPTPTGTLAATHAGLFLHTLQGGWQPVEGTPATYAYALREINGTLYAAFENRGVWAAAQARGPWRQHGLAGRTVLDIAEWNGQPAAGSATDRGVFYYNGRRWLPLPTLPPGPRGRAAAQFVPRLAVGSAGELVALSEGRLLRWEPDGEEWVEFGPAVQQGKITALENCCGVGTLIGVESGGIWSLGRGGLERDLWQPIADEALAALNVAEIADANGRLLVAAANGLFVTDAAQPGPLLRVAGLPPTVSDLAVHPGDPALWFAATPVGVQRSRDGGASWQPVGPPWVAREVVFREDGRLYAALHSGLAWTETAGAPEPTWTLADGLPGVTFFTVVPLPPLEEGDRRVWAGTWGNAIGVSDDGGQTIAPLRGDLDTLSVPAILYEPEPHQVIAGTAEGLYRSSDEGATWARMPTPFSSQTIYALHRSADSALIAGTSDGLWVSYDYGASWDRGLGLPAAAVLAVGALVDASGQPLLWAGLEGEGIWLSRSAAVWHAGGLAGRSVFQVMADPAGGAWLAATDAGIFTTGAPPRYQ